MNKSIKVFIIAFYSGICIAQNTTGITGIKDTSYNTLSAYRATAMSHPGIKIAEEIQDPALMEKRNITYQSWGKRKLKLDVFYNSLPAASKKVAVLIVHGGGWRTGDRTQHYPLAQRLALKGYVCFTPEYRLSTEALYPAAIYDLKSAVRWIRKNAKKYNIDTGKIAAYGFSAGGELVAFLGATNNMQKFEGDGVCKNISSSLNAVIDNDGILSFTHTESGEGDDSKKISAATHWFGYPKKDNVALWDEASALTHVGNHAPPILFINSAVSRMHAGREDFNKILDTFNIYHQEETFENSPHSFCLFHPWFEPTLEYIDAFLKKVFLVK